MAKPEGTGSSCRLGLGLVSLGVTLVAVAGLAVCVMCLDARRQHQLAQLSDQLDTLQQLVDLLQKQLDQHENTTLHAKITVSKEPTEEVYEDDVYEYDDDGSYEYDEDEPTPKTTVKRTTVLGENTLVTNSTEESAYHRPQQETPTRTSRRRRDVKSQAVPVREERYVPSSTNLKDFLNSKNKSEGLRMYASYFGKKPKYLQQIHQSKYSSFESSTNRSGAPQGSKISNQRIAKYSHQTRPLVYQEQRRPEESIVRLRHGGRNKNVNLENVELISENSPEEFSPPQNPTAQHILAAHFVGDASNYNSRDHAHYYGNNILYHPHGLFKDWVPANWMFELGSYSQFPFHNGKLSIQKPGTYFVYAQIYYAATHDRCGFHIKHNGEEVAQCMTMSTGRILKRNTCFTAVVLHLHKSDMLWISEVEGYRNTSFKSSHSFFGLIQLTPT